MNFVKHVAIVVICVLSVLILVPADAECEGNIQVYSFTDDATECGEKIEYRFRGLLKFTQTDAIGSDSALNVDNLKKVFDDRTQNSGGNDTIVIAGSRIFQTDRKADTKRGIPLTEYNALQPVFDGCMRAYRPTYPPELAYESFACEKLEGDSSVLNMPRTYGSDTIIVGGDYVDDNEP